MLVMITRSPSSREEQQGVPEKLTDQGNQNMACPATSEQHRDWHNLTMPDGTFRQFLVFRPKGLIMSKKVPVMFVWHGYAGDPEGIATITTMDQRIQKGLDDAGQPFMAVFPMGTGIIRGFNGAGSLHFGAWLLSKFSNLPFFCRCCVKGANDVEFTKLMIAYLGTHMCADTGNLFSTGFSNGGFMTQKLGCQMASQFRAVAPHSGLMGRSFLCKPDAKVPFLSLIGTSDSVVPYNGTVNWLPFPRMVNRWLTINGCPDESKATVSHPTSTTTCWRFDDCSASGIQPQTSSGRTMQTLSGMVSRDSRMTRKLSWSEWGVGPDEVAVEAPDNDSLDVIPVQWCTVSGLPHVWSGSDLDEARHKDVHATDLIYNFFVSSLAST